MGVIVPAGAAGRTTVEGYDPKKHDPYFDGVSQQLADKGQCDKIAPVQGSWWPTFAAWLAWHSSATKVKPPAMGAPKKGLRPLADALFDEHGVIGEVEVHEHVAVM